MSSSMRSSSSSLTHNTPDHLSRSEIAAELSLIKERLEKEFKDQPEQLKSFQQTLEDLADFELGRFLIKNKSLSGYWTWYVILGFNSKTITSPLEKFMLEKAPAILATQQRFAIFQSLLAKHIKSNAVVCSLPCGMMADLLTLKLPEEVKELRFVGIDLDVTVFDLAKDLAAQLKVGANCEFFQKDAWNLGIENEFDVLTTNGLNIYEKDDSRVVALYRGMHRALKDQGHLICSALTPPPTATDPGEWDMSKVNLKDLGATAALFKVVLGATWSNFRSSAKTEEQLREAGFDNIEIHWDQQKMFPTFSAQKLAPAPR